jgi:hypothetical protein
MTPSEIIRGKFVPPFNYIPHHKDIFWGAGVKTKIQTLLTSLVDRGEWLASCPGHFIPGVRQPTTHQTRSLADPRACLNSLCSSPHKFKGFVVHYITPPTEQ